MCDFNVGDGCKIQNALGHGFRARERRVLYNCKLQFILKLKYMYILDPSGSNFLMVKYTHNVMTYCNLIL